MSGAELQERAVPMVDLHVDLPYQHVYQGLPFAEGTGQFPASKLRQAGVVGVVLPLFVPARVSADGPRLVDLETSYRRVLDALKLTPTYAAPGCALPGSASVRTFLAFEGAGPLAEQPEQLDQWVDRGVRSVGLVHTRANALASSSGDPTASAGLTARGRLLVERAQRLGVPVDVSHASDRAAREVLALAAAAKVPVIATHSNARSLAAHPRNLSDSLIRAIAHSGGVVGVNFHSRFLTGGTKSELADVVRHIRYLVRTAGVDHVALGTDFEGDIRAPRGLESIVALPELSRRLRESGLSRAAIESVFSRNALRVLCGSANTEH